MKLRSYAKINLSLDVTGLREDGYHTVETVMQSVDLYDELEFIWHEAGRCEASEKSEVDNAEGLEKPGLEISLSCNRPYLPCDEKNLAFKAARLMGDLYGVRGQIKIHIEKHIPVAAGLAGGSGNAAAVIIALNRLWKLRLSTRKLCEIGSGLGADVAFCIFTQNTSYHCALGTGVGEILTPVSEGLRKYILLAKPHFGVSTKDVFIGIDNCEIPERPDTGRLMEALKADDFDTVSENMINVLENFTLNEYPAVKELKNKIEKTDYVEKVLMSGSGPTVFAVYSSSRAVKNACMKMREEGYEAYWTRTMVKEEKPRSGRMRRGADHD